MVLLRPPTPAPPAHRVRAPRGPVGAGGRGRPAVSSWLPPTLALTLVAVATLGPGVPGRVAAAVAVAGIVLGVPHGAVDHLVPGWVLHRRSRGLFLVRVLLAYLAVAGIATVGFLLVPDVAVGVFLVVSAAHFGWAEVTYAAERRGLPVPSPGQGAWPALAHGLAVVGLPVLAWPGTTVAVLSPLAPGLAGALVRPAGAPAVTLLLLLVAAVCAGLARAGRWREAAETVVVALLFWLVSPLAAFGLYFGLWHAVRHSARLLPALAPGAGPAEQVRRYAAVAALPTGLALGALALVARAGAADASEPVVTAGLCVLLALTFPHVVTVAWLDRSRRGR